MSVQTVKNTMLYCPKCQKTYDEGSQRFCSVEGERLLPVAAGKSSNQKSGVFTNVLNRRTDEEGDKFSSVPKFSQTGSRSFSQPNFSLPSSSKIFQSDPDIQLELEPQIESKPILSEPLPQFIKARETEPIKKQVADEDEVNSTSEFNTASDNPQSLIGQTIKNRYRVVEQIGVDESGVTYLAEDETLDNRKVILKAMTEENDSFANKIFAEERASLAQINHPNIANIIDSGELSDGKSYIVTEYVSGKTVKDYLENHGQFNILRAARIVRQTADALGEAHQIGVVHRSLKPENIVLTVTENGVEQVKLTNFGAAKDKLNEENLLYKSPEQVEGKISNAASDEYSLAVIAYQMLTNRLPFNASSVGDLLKAQREGLMVRPSDVREDLPPLVDEILERAVSFNPFDRFSKVRDFGDDFFSEIIANSPLEMDDEEEDAVELITEKIETEEPVFTPPLPIEDETPSIVFEPKAEEISTVVSEPSLSDVEISKDITVEEDEDLIRSVKATHDLAWEKRSPKPIHEANPRGNLISLLGVGVALVVLFGAWYYFINRPAEKFVPPVESVNQDAATTETTPISEPNTNVAEPTPSQELETPPLPRSIKQPPDTVYFQNSKENLKGDVMKNFLGFSLYYPKDWKQNEAGNNFLDVSKNTKDGLPVEQMLVSYYNSKGTFKADSPNFPAQVKETNSTLKKFLPDYKMISEGKKTVNNGWQAYEVKFQGTGKNASGEKITIWGKRLFIPTAIRGMKNGYVVTMLATSLSKDIQSVDDIGVKGELSSVLETFEPNQNF